MCESNVPADPGPALAAAGVRGFMMGILHERARTGARDDDDEIADAEWLISVGGVWLNMRTMRLSLGTLQLIFTGDVALYELTVHLALLWSGRGSKFSLSHDLAVNPTRGLVRRLAAVLHQPLTD